MRGLDSEGTERTRKRIRVGGVCVGLSFVCHFILRVLGGCASLSLCLRGRLAANKDCYRGVAGVT